MPGVFFRGNTVRVHGLDTLIEKKASINDRALRNWNSSKNYSLSESEQQDLMAVQLSNITDVHIWPVHINKYEIKKI